MKKEKSGSNPPSSDSEPEAEPQREITPDPEQIEAILEDVLDSVRKYQEYQRRKGEGKPGPEQGEG